jgi:hypothetical protein
MKMLLLIILKLTVAVCPAFGNEAAVATAKLHLKATLTGDAASLGNSYAAEVRLMPGHEFLKPSHGFTTDAQRKTATVVASDKLIAAIKRETEAQPRKPERIEAMLKSITLASLEVREGDFAVAPSDPVNTEDGKLHFQIVKGDLLLKVSPPKGDFFLLQMRSVDGKWRVVAEYLD